MRKNLGNVKKMTVIAFVALTMMSLTACGKKKASNDNDQTDANPITASVEGVDVVDYVGTEVVTQNSSENSEKVLSDEAKDDEEKENEEKENEEKENEVISSDEVVENENPNEQGVVEYSAPEESGATAPQLPLDENPVSPVKEEAPANSGAVTNKDDCVKVDPSEMQAVEVPFESADPNIDRQGGNCPYPLMTMTTRTYYSATGQCADYPGMYCTSAQVGKASAMALKWSLQNDSKATQKKIGTFDDTGDVYFVFYGL